MKNIKSLLMIGAALFATALTASASLYSDTNVHNETLSEGESASGQWSYGPIGAGETVTKVETWFRFSSGDNDSEQFHIALGTGEGGTDATTTSGVFNFGSGYTFNWAFNNSASLFADAANGLLSYVVTAVDNNSRNWENDFTFEWAKVEVTTSNSNVPDGGATIALLGLSFLAFAGAQRKFRLVR